MANLRHRFRNEIMKQFRNGKKLIKAGQGHFYQKSRSHGNFYHAVWSKNSKKALLDSASRTSKIFKELKFSDLDKDNYQARAKAMFDIEKERGYSSGTMSQDMRFLNHYLVGSGVITVKNRLLKKDMGFGSRSSDIGQQRYKNLSSEEWIKENPKKYARWEQPIKFIQDTGLRRSELNGYKLYEVDNQLKALTIGKNGKVRFADVREGKELEVMHFSKVSEVPKISHDQANSLVSNANYAKSVIKNSGQSIYLTKNVPSHIHRAYYAQQLVQELNAKNDYSGEAPYISRRGVVHNSAENYTVGAYTAQYGAWEEVSRSLGHNRLDVLKNYCGIGR